MHKNILGIDVGSVAVSVVITTVKGEIIETGYIIHLQHLIGIDIQTDSIAHLYGAYGAVLSCMADRHIISTKSLGVLSNLFTSRTNRRVYAHPPLTFQSSSYPNFEKHASYLFNPAYSSLPSTVEADIYMLDKSCHIYSVYIGLDIGSTSTKAIVMDQDNNVLAGFYTRTAGRPVEAVQALFEAIDDLSAKKGIVFNFMTVGVTGSGRKLIGQIIGADLILDEITAHARAAVELDPEVDTIIEIGGQDAKFTTLENGRVTFASMNTVCAAGTGSFIEEQASRLNCQLSNYADRTENQKAPLTSDRCTVFMERDINHHLNEGYAAEEMLTAALHAVTENYLVKVAIESRIGKVIFFQGATAKNRALVAAFEQRLGKPLFVSRYCHLTGAIGAALTLSDQFIKTGEITTTFRGVQLYREQIPIRQEVCDLCVNHCKLTVAKFSDNEAAYGFQCGRDYNTHRYIDPDASNFNLLKTRRRIIHVEKPVTVRESFTVGIPAALHMLEDIPFWQYFFHQLGISTLTSTGVIDAVKQGKSLTGAEFCAPITALHGHIPYLLEKSDYVFIPFYLENAKENRHARRQYCYYTQYAPTLIHDVVGKENRSRLLMTDAFLGRIDYEEAVAQSVVLLEKIPVKVDKRPQVAIFGDLYVRDNKIFNQDLIHFIETNGGEVLTTPYSTYAKMIAGSYFNKWFKEGKYWHSMEVRTLLASVRQKEKKYYSYFERILGEPDYTFDVSAEKILTDYDLVIEHTGESMDNILKIFYIHQHYPDVALFVQTNPAFCCPSIVTQAMSKKIEEKTGIPVVSITYDGTAAFKNSKIIPYLKYPRKT